MFNDCIYCDYNSQAFFNFNLIKITNFIKIIDNNIWVSVFRCANGCRFHFVWGNGNNEKFLKKLEKIIISLKEKFNR